MPSTMAWSVGTASEARAAWLRTKCPAPRDRDQAPAVVNSAIQIETVASTTDATTVDTIT